MVENVNQPRGLFKAGSMRETATRDLVGLWRFLGVCAPKGRIENVASWATKAETGVRGGRQVRGVERSVVGHYHVPDRKCDVTPEGRM